MIPSTEEVKNCNDTNFFKKFRSITLTENQSINSDFENVRKYLHSAK